MSNKETGHRGLIASVAEPHVRAGLHWSGFRSNFPSIIYEKIFDTHLLLRDSLQSTRFRYENPTSYGFKISLQEKQINTQTTVYMTWNKDHENYNF